jgi:uncharacterized protein YdhG (YjbR/CyaY superfamily)
MKRPNFYSVDQYIAAQTAEVQAVIVAVRRAIREAVPDADEGISYQMPTYKLRGRAMLHFAAWKRHYSLYPASPRVVTELGDQLAPYQVASRTIRFPLTGPVPVELIANLARVRAAEVSTARAQLAVEHMQLPVPF